MTVRRVAVIGLGLMGGSLARELAARDVRVLGSDRHEPSVAAALATGAVHERLDDDYRGIGEDDVVVVALPVPDTRALLERCAPALSRARLVMDMGSTKASIVTAAVECGLGGTFVGAHPLTGSHRSGWGASRTGMFEGARVFLTPTPATSADTLTLAARFWRSLGAGTETMDAAEHDVQMAWRSHLPHVMSSALATLLADRGIRRSALGPGGRDMTRLAGGSSALWTGIAHDNVPALVQGIEALEARLAEVRTALVAGDQAATAEFFAVGCDWFDGSPGALSS